MLFGTQDAQMLEERNWRQTILKPPPEPSPDPFESPQRKLGDASVNPRARARGFRGTSSRRQKKFATAGPNRIAMDGFFLRHTFGKRPGMAFSKYT